MLGMTSNKVESVKIIGSREMNMDTNMKNIFEKEDLWFVKPYYNDAQFSWETFNSRKIKTVFFSAGFRDSFANNDYGTKIRIKCYGRINRIKETLDGEKCANWQNVDSFGVRESAYGFSPYTFYPDRPYGYGPYDSGSYGSSPNGSLWSFDQNFNNPVYRNFYDPMRDLMEPTHGWENHVTMIDPSFNGEKGFLLTNGTFSRFEAIGVTWNDSYCRRITNGGQSGCFVERDITIFPIADLDDPRNNCSGSDFNRFFSR